MKMRNLRAVGISVSLLMSAACSLFGNNEKNENSGNKGPGVNNAAVGGSVGGGGGPAASTQPQTDVAHAVGTVTLAEVHAPAGTPTPAVFAGFRPNATGEIAAVCSREVLGCNIANLPACGTCKEHEGCAFDATCTARCTRLCDITCADGEECYFPVAGAPACRKKETFDAGSINFAGGPSPIAIFPPYAFSGTPGTTPFLPGANMKVVASGAVGAGFSAFERPFTATTFVQTAPALSSIPTSVVYGNDALPISWVPGNGRLLLKGMVTNSSGATGSFECELNDAAGSAVLARDVIAQASQQKPAASLTLTLERRNSVLHKDLATTGQLVTQKVEATAWLEIVTSSSESYTFKGCDAGQTPCGNACANLATDPTNCGTCGKVCDPGYACKEGQCARDCGALKLCGASCVDLSSNSANCGACGKACSPGTVCKSGSCSCPYAGVLCGTTCVDLETDEANCGSCGKKCPSGTTCNSGNCRCTNGLLTLCGSSCVSLPSDKNNCGGCGTRCTTGQVCTGSRCLTELCEGDKPDRCSSGCTNIESDVSNCGECGNRCSSPTPICDSGECVCNDGRPICGAVCCGEDESCWSSALSTTCE